MHVVLLVNEFFNENHNQYYYKANQSDLCCKKNKVKEEYYVAKN